MIGAHSQVSRQPRQRSVLSKRHLVRTFYHLIPSMYDLSSPPHSNRTPGSKFKCCRRRDARCSHRQLGMIGIIEYLLVVCRNLGIFGHHQIPVICTSHLPTVASKTSCCAIIYSPVTVCPIYNVGKPVPTIRVEYPVLVNNTYCVKTVLK